MAQKKDKFGVPISDQYIIPEKTKLTSNYIFKPLSGIVEILESDVRNVISIVNVDASQLIYNAAASDMNANRTGNTFDLNYNTSSMNQNDKLIILYEYNDSGTKDILDEILSELKTQTKMLKKIYDFAFIFGSPYGLRLRAGTNDKLIFKIRDNLSSGIDEHNAIAYGIKF